MPLSRQFYSEKDLENHYQNAIADFWQNRFEGQFVGQQGIKINYCNFVKKSHDKAIIVVNGRTETFNKYKEVFYDLFHQGFDIYSYDHRGQGVSQRLVIGSDVGHIDKFDDYIEDLTSFFEIISSQKSHQSRSILAHSMGGAIATLFATKKPSYIDKLILSAPMFDIYLPGWLKPIAQPLSWVLSKLTHPASYAIGQTSYKDGSTEMDLLTHSKVRFEIYRKLYDQYENIQVGGPSAHWILESLNVTKPILDAAKTIPVPILLIQGAKDQIVCNETMLKFVRSRQAAMLPIQFEIMENAKHELLFEQDEVRNRVLNLILDFA